MEDNEKNQTMKQKVEFKQNDIVKTKSKKRYVLPVFIIIVLLSCLGYYAYDKIQEKEYEIFTTGIKYGAESLLADIFNEATTCNPIPITNGSLDINLIAAECLSMPE